MSNNYGPRIVTDGLISCLDAADRNSYAGSGSTWYDLSGNSRNNLLRNMSTSNWNSDGYFECSAATSQHFEDNFASVDVSNGYSICSFFKPLSLGGAVVQLYGQDNHNLRVSVQDNYRIVFQTYDATGLYSADNVISLNTWYFLVCTFSGVSTKGASGVARTYLNGDLITSGDRNGSQSWTYRFRISRLNASYMSSLFSSVHLYNKELSPKEIQDNYNALKGRFGL
jgi:hypothetical protein